MNLPKVERKTIKEKRFNIKKFLFKFIIITFAIVNITGFIVGGYIYNKVCKIDKNRISTTPDMAIRLLDLRRKKYSNAEDVIIPSKYGYSLFGTYIKSPKRTDDTVILVHGVTANRVMLWDYKDIYLDQGYNVLFYDARGHGESGGNDITYGYYEKYDMDEWVNWVKKKTPGGVIGIHGISMGAATAVLHSGLNEKNHKVDFYVVDCPYSDLEKLFLMKGKEELLLKNDFLIKGSIKYASCISNIKSKFKFRDVSPVKVIKNVHTPMLFIHGSKDTFIPQSMSIDLYKAKPGYKQYYRCEGASHAESFYLKPKEYKKIVDDFIYKVTRSKQKTDI